MVPIELKNGCSESDLVIDSDDVTLTNVIRAHYLQHFGHRDLDGIVSQYCTGSPVLVHVVNGLDRKSYHGCEEIRAAFAEIFKLHPTVNSTFELKQIIVQQREATVTWDAQTPTHIFEDCQDKFVFNQDHKIVKQFFTCHMSDLDTPWYITDE
jgi:hypothetical protein